MNSAIVLFFAIIIGSFVSGCASHRVVTHQIGKEVYEGGVVNSKGNHFGHAHDKITVVNGLSSGNFVELLRNAYTHISALPSGEQITFRPRYSPDAEMAFFIIKTYTIDGSGQRQYGKIYTQSILINQRDMPLVAGWVVSDSGLSPINQYSPMPQGFGGYGGWSGGGQMTWGSGSKW